MGKKQTKPAVPPKEAPEPTAGGKTWSADLTSLLDAVRERFPDVERRDARMVDEPALLVTPDRVLELAKFLYGYEKLPMNYCRCVTGTDKVDKYEVVYNLASMHLGDVATSEGFERLALVVVIKDRENPVTPSLIDVWRTADFQEREAYDLVGIKFDGHPDLRRILLDEKFIGHPLRKDYPLEGRLEDMRAMCAYLDEDQVRLMKEEAGEEFDPVRDVPPNFRR